MLNLPFKFLIATSKSIFLYSNNEISKLLDGGVFFGLTQLKDQYIALNRNNFDGTGGGNPNGINSLDFFNSEFKHIGGVELGFIKDGHQIYADENEDLIITNTGLNMLTKISQDGKILNLIPNPEHGKDVHHYNSISKYKNTWMVNQHRSKEGLDDGGVMLFNENWTKIDYIPIGKHVHNCKGCDGFIWVTKSYDGKLVRVNMSDINDRVEYDISPGHLTRGIIIAHEYLLVGLSEFDNRDNRHKNKTGRVKVYKYPEIKYLDTIEIPDCGQVNDILLV